MKTTLKLLTCAAMLFVVACGKDDDGGGGKTENEKLIEQISAKWDISANANYVSLELNKSGNYIVVKNAANRAATDNFEVIFGVYKVLNATTVELVDFGKITINSITSSSLSVKLTLPGTFTPIDLNAQKVDNSTNIPASTKTELLCRTWEPTKINGVDVSLSSDDDIPSKVLFSAAGTYLVHLKNGETDLANWKWFDANQNKFYYSWSFPPVWEENGEGNRTAELTTLTSTKLVVTERNATETTVTELKPTTTVK